MFIRNINLFFVSILFATCSVYSRINVKAYSPPQSALVVEYSNNKTKILYQQSAYGIRHPASLTKMMTVYMLLEAIQSKRIKTTTLFRVSNFASIQMPSKLNLKPGSYISAIDCVKALLVKSANDVAVVVAEGLSGSVPAFCQRMNAKAKALGMVSTHFENPSGVPNKRQVTTASDILKLGLALYKKFPQYWKYFALKSFTYKGQKHATHCKILGWYKGSDGAKTGFINASGFNLWVTAQRYSNEGQPKRLFAVVFGGHSGRERDFNAARLMDKFFNGYTSNKPTQKLQKKNDKITKSDVPCSQDTSDTKSIKDVLSGKSKQPTITTNIPTSRSHNDEILYELYSTPIDDILEMSGKTKEYFDDLYKDDRLCFINNTANEEPLQIIESKDMSQIETTSKHFNRAQKIGKKSEHKSKNKKQSIKNSKLRNTHKKTKQKQKKNKADKCRQSFNQTIDRLF